MKRKHLPALLILLVCLLGPSASAADLAVPPHPQKEITVPVSQPRLRVCICADAVHGVLCGNDGTVLQELTFDRNGQAAAGPLYPGRYHVKAAGLSVSFTLLHNASLSRAEGDGWTDGELLYLQAAAP